MELEFSRQIFRKTAYSKSNSMKIRPEGAEMFYANGRTGSHHEPNNRLSQFCERV